MRTTYIFLLLLVTVGGFAQRQSIPASQERKDSTESQYRRKNYPPVRKTSKKEEDKKVAEDYKMKAYGVTVNTNSGLLGGFIFRSSKTISSWGEHPINRYIAVELVNVKHQKEKTETSGIGSRIIIDKQNYLFVLRPQYGRELFFFKKYGEEGVGVSGIIAGGPSLGIEKPYYIKYVPQGQMNAETVPFDPAIQTDPQRIIGTGSFFQGLGSSNLIPGVHLKLGINLDVNTFGNSLTGFEIGLLAEWFTRKPVIMAYAENQQFFTSGYLTLYFGSKNK